MRPARAILLAVPVAILAGCGPMPDLGGGAGRDLPETWPTLLPFEAFDRLSSGGGEDPAAEVQARAARLKARAEALRRTDP